MKKVAFGENKGGCFDYRKRRKKFANKNKQGHRV